MYQLLLSREYVKISLCAKRRETMQQKPTDENPADQTQSDAMQQDKKNQDPPKQFNDLSLSEQQRRSMDGSRPRDEQGAKRALGHESIGERVEEGAERVVKGVEREIAVVGEHIEEEAERVVE